MIFPIPHSVYKKRLDSQVTILANSSLNLPFAELFSGAKKVLTDRENLEGDIYTTIEPTVQKELQRSVQVVQDKQHSQLTGAIIMDPYTGEIRAMAQVPGFNPEDTKGISDISVYKNDAVEGSHEMGSIIKPLTMAVGIDTGKVHANTTYSDAGFVKVRDRTIYNFDKKARGTITLQTALSQSLNTGFVHIAQLVGNDELTKYFLKFGLGEKTGIDLPDESAPLTKNLEKGDVEHATASFGQGIAMTPLGTIRALSVLANGGYLVQPHVIEKVKHSVGTVQTTNIPKLDPDKALLKAATIDEIRGMLVYNVDNALLDGKRKNPHYSIGAKTGTAQIASQNGGYIEGKNMHTFIGFFPAYNPKFIVFMYTIDPRVSQYASESLANSFLDLTDFLIQYYQVAPDR
ncbi:MAG: penicillin-binding protein 2 [Patescibacteria group bacterium]